MHTNSLNIMQKFITDFLYGKEFKILDLGSRVLPGQEDSGSYHQFCTNKKWLEGFVRRGDIEHLTIEPFPSVTIIRKLT